MDRQDYALQFLEHYESPRHHGPLADADVVARGENPGCGDIITIYMRVNGGGVAEQVQFEGEGCTISLAAASMLMEMVQGKTLAEIQALDYNDLLDSIGRDVVLTRVRCASLGLKTLKEAVRQYYTQQLQPSA
ncbi:MAG: SUF system NifU family Fe-S cluster assembly protein [Anaerolineae bacterium]